MDFTQFFKYVKDISLPVAILIIFLTILFNLLREERKDHKKTRSQLNGIYSRLEERLYRELDELERLLREERASKK